MNFGNFGTFLTALGHPMANVRIQVPPNSGSQFLNYKHTFYIVLLALVDVQYKFIIIDIGSFGESSDRGIITHSELGEYL
jgi:hypothetical protein